MYTVYVLKSLADKRTYIGCTKDLENRIKKHNAGEVKSTKARIPFVLWYKEEFIDKYEAFNREQHFKNGLGKKTAKKYFRCCPKVTEININVHKVTRN